MFDAIEILHENVTLKSWEADNEFGLDSGVFNILKAQRDFRYKINKQIARYDKGWELLTDGSIRELVDEELREFVDNPIEYGDEENVDKRIKRASKSFLKYGATEFDKKAALLEIGGH